MALDESLTLDEAHALAEYARTSGLESLKPAQIVKILRSHEVPFKEIAAAKTKPLLLVLCRSNGITEIPDEWTIERKNLERKAESASIEAVMAATVPGATTVFEEDPNGSALLPMSPWKIREKARRKTERRGGTGGTARRSPSRSARSPPSAKRPSSSVRGGSATKASNSPPAVAAAPTAPAPRRSQAAETEAPAAARGETPAAARGKVGRAAAEARASAHAKSDGAAASGEAGSGREPPRSSERDEAALSLREVMPGGPTMDDLRDALIAGHGRPQITPRHRLRGPAMYRK